MIRHDNWVLWFVVGLVLVIGCTGLIGLAGDPETARESAPERESKPSKPSGPPLFADASSGIEQFIGGQTIPTGTYDFKCGSLGNVSIQLGAPPYTVSMKTGDQTRRVGPGDMVTMGYCKAYGP